MIDKWIGSPMNESDILKEFYDADGNPYFGEDYNTDDGLFDGDNYDEEYEEDLYWYYGEDWYEEDEFDGSDYEDYEEYEEYESDEDIAG